MSRVKALGMFGLGLTLCLLFWQKAVGFTVQLATDWSPWGWEATITRDGMKPIRESRASAKIHFLDDPSKLKDPEKPFHMVMRGRFHALEDGPHRFILRGDDGFRLYVNGSLKIDHWRNRTYRGSRQDRVVHLTKGWHDLRIEMHHVDDAPRIHAVWTQPNGRRELPLIGPWVRKPLSSDEE